MKKYELNADEMGLVVRALSIYEWQQRCEADEATLQGEDGEAKRFTYIATYAELLRFRIENA